MTNLSFSRLYAAYAAQFTEDLPFWLELATSSGSPILELGCGPGRVLRALAQAGFDVIGLDNNENMLRWAHSQIPEQDLIKTSLIHSDMRNFQLPDLYPLIIVPCNTFAYFDDPDALQMLMCVRQHLTHQGQLAMAIPNPTQYTSFESDLDQEEQTGSEPINDFVDPVSGHPVQVYAYEQLDRENGILHVQWAFDELLPDGQVERIRFPIRYHLRSLEEMTQLLHEAQMDLRYAFGDYQRGPINPGSHEMIIIAANAPDNPQSSHQYGAIEP